VKQWCRLARQKGTVDLLQRVRARCTDASKAHSTLQTLLKSADFPRAIMAPGAIATLAKLPAFVDTMNPASLMDRKVRAALCVLRGANHLPGKVLRDLELLMNFIIVIDARIAQDHPITFEQLVDLAADSGWQAHVHQRASTCRKLIKKSFRERFGRSGGLNVVELYGLPEARFHTWSSFPEAWTRVPQGM